MTDEPLYAPPFWLSHQRYAKRHKCLHIGHSYICARCLGTYPVLFLVLLLQLRRPLAPLVLPYDPIVLWVLPIPAVLDWSLGQLTAWRGSNAVRLLSGALLGVALGRALYIHMRHPGEPRVFALLLGLCGAAGIVWGLGQVLGSPTSGSGDGDAG